MNRDISYRASWVEALENRRLLSASADGLVLEALSAQPSVLVAPLVTTPSIVGTFTGSYNETTPSKVTGSLVVTVNTETYRGTITGVMTTKAPHEHSQIQDFTGKIKGDSFTMTTTQGSVIAGTASDNGHDLTGTFKGSGDATGTFSATRPRHR